MRQADKKEQLFFSEDLNPIAEHCIGRWYRICEDATPENLYHECRNFWFGMKALQKLGIACNNARDRDGATHYVVALGNMQRDVAKYIEKKTGENPITDKLWKM